VWVPEIARSSQRLLSSSVLIIDPAKELKSG
jgi:hypothetical protein